MFETLGDYGFILAVIAYCVLLVVSVRRGTEGSARFGGSSSCCAVADGLRGCLLAEL